MRPHIFRNGSKQMWRSRYLLDQIAKVHNGYLRLPRMQSSFYNITKNPTWRWDVEVSIPDVERIIKTVLQCLWMTLYQQLEL